MSFKNIELTGNTGSVEQVERTTGDFNEISLQCGKETLTLRGKITEVIRSLGVSSVVAVRVEEPGRAAYEVTSEESPKLADSHGNDRPFVEGTQVTPVYGGKAY
jgi:hypothetical protein